MDYYDGNTVTGLWNYAQHYAMSDNSYSTVFGPSTPGALNLVSGQTHGVYAVDPVTGAEGHRRVHGRASPDAKGVGTVINDPDPAYDDCSDNNHTSTTALVGMTGQNIGDLLNKQGVTWGWFQGGFRPTTWDGNGYSVVRRHAPRTSVAPRWSTTARTTTRSSTTSRRPTRTTCRRPRSRRSGTPTRPTTSTT